MARRRPRKPEAGERVVARGSPLREDEDSSRARIGVRDARELISRSDSGRASGRSRERPRGDSRGSRGARGDSRRERSRDAPRYGERDPKRGERPDRRMRDDELEGRHGERRERFDAKLAARRGMHRDDKAREDTRKGIRCMFWPRCTRGAECPFEHPAAEAPAAAEQCRFFPNCAQPTTCVYAHPRIPCRFGAACRNLGTCNYVHDAPAAVPGDAPHGEAVSLMDDAASGALPGHAEGARMCRHGERCTRPDCRFAHPPGRVLAPRALVNAPCRFGARCTREDCAYLHEDSPGDMHVDNEVMLTE